MGILGPLFGFSLGTAFGIYLEQTYGLPSVREWAERGRQFAREMEAKYRKQPEGAAPAQQEEPPSRPPDGPVKSHTETGGSFRPWR